jgi:hypothetical protein
MSGDEEYDEDEGTEFRVFCDASQVTLTCDGGWYHKIGEDYDLCTAEYEKLSEDEQKKYVQVQSPEDLGDDLGMYAEGEGMEDLEDMDPEQLLEMLRDAFTAREGRPPTEEEAEALVQMLFEGQLGGEDDSDDESWETDDEDGDSDSDEEESSGSDEPVPVELPDSSWDAQRLTDYIGKNGGAVLKE